MNFGFLGLGGSGGETIGYFSHRNFLDFDVLVWRPEQLVHELSQPASTTQVDRVRGRRSADFNDFFRHGRNLVVLTTPPVPFQLANPAHPIPVMDFVPGSPRTIALSGSTFIESFGGSDSAIRQFWEGAASLFPSYSAYLEGSPGRPFLFAPGSERRAVASLLPIESGNILFLPFLQISRTDLLHDFVELLETLFDELSLDEEPLPGWLVPLRTSRERAVAVRVTRLEAEAAIQARSLAELKAELDAEERRKLLISASGKTLERQVMLALQELGMEVSPGPESSDDLLLNFEGSSGVAEVKGVTGSATQKHAAQLEKWCSNRQLAGENVKGFLIVNAFRELPLADRQQPAFPENVVTYSRPRGHCLIGTSQLFAAVADAREHPERRAEIARKIWDTIGLFEDYSDAHNLLSQ